MISQIQLNRFWKFGCSFGDSERKPISGQAHSNNCKLLAQLLSGTSLNVENNTKLPPEQIQSKSFVSPFWLNTFSEIMEQREELIDYVASKCSYVVATLENHIKDNVEVLPIDNIFESKTEFLSVLSCNRQALSTIMDHVSLEPYPIESVSGEMLWNFEHFNSVQPMVGLSEFESELLDVHSDVYLNSQVTYVKKFWEAGMLNSFESNYKKNFKKGDTKSVSVLNLSGKDKTNFVSAFKKAVSGSINTDGSITFDDQFISGASEIVDLISFHNRVDGFGRSLKCKDSMSSNVLYFSLKCSPEDARNSMACGKNTLWSQIENKDFYQILDQEFYYHNEFGDTIKNYVENRPELSDCLNLFETDETIGYCDLLWEDFNSSCERPNRLSSKNQMKGTTNLHLTLGKKNKSYFRDWFNVIGLSPNRCIMAVRKDVWLFMTSNWMNHTVKQFPLYPQLIKHWRIPSKGNTAVDRLRKYNVLRKTLFWMYFVPEHQKSQFMLGPDHVDFDRCYSDLWKIIDLWRKNSSLAEFQRAMERSYENRKEASLMRSMVAYLMIKKNHVINRRILDDLEAYLDSISKGECKKISKKHPNLRNVISQMKSHPTVNDIILGHQVNQKVISLHEILEKDHDRGSKKSNNNGLGAKTSDVLVPVKNVEPEVIQNSNIGLNCFGRLVSGTRRLYSTQDKLASPRTDEFLCRKRKRRSGGELMDPVLREKLLTSDPIVEDVKKRKVDDTRIPSISDLEVELNVSHYPRLRDDIKMYYTIIWGDAGCYSEFRSMKKRKLWNEMIDSGIEAIEDVNITTNITESSSTRLSYLKPATNYQNRLQRILKKRQYRREHLHSITENFCEKKKKSNYAYGKLKHNLEHIRKPILWNMENGDKSAFIHSQKEEKEEKEGERIFLEKKATINELYLEECSEQWLKLGEYLATKTLYAVCACDLFPQELRKNLFLSMSLIEAREERKVETESLKIVRVSKPQYEIGPLGIPKPKTVSSSSQKGLDRIENTFSVNLAETADQSLPCDYDPEAFKPNFYKGASSVYTKFILKCRKIQFSETIGKLDRNKKVDTTPRSYSDGSCVSKKDSVPISQMNITTKKLFCDYHFPVGDWLWQDNVIFGDDRQKRKVMLNLIKEESEGSIEETQRYFLAHLEYIYHTNPYVPKNGATKDKKFEYTPTKDKLNIAQTALPYTTHGRSFSQQLFGDYIRNRKGSVIQHSKHHERNRQQHQQKIVAIPLGVKEFNSMDLLFGKMRDFDGGISLDDGGGGGDSKIEDNCKFKINNRSKDNRNYDGAIMVLFKDNLKSRSEKIWQDLFLDSQNQRNKSPKVPTIKKRDEPLIISTLEEGAFQRYEFYKYCMQYLFPFMYYNWYRDICKMRNFGGNLRQKQQQQQQQRQQTPILSSSNQNKPVNEKVVIKNPNKSNTVNASMNAVVLEEKNKIWEVDPLSEARVLLKNVKGLEGLNEDEMLMLLQSTKYFIDSGYIVRFWNHEDDTRETLLKDKERTIKGKMCVIMTRYR